MWSIIRRIFTRRPKHSDAPQPRVLAKALPHTRYNATATRSAEFFSGGFMYSDKVPASWYFDPNDGGYAFPVLL